jgi:peptide/nickel transport system substrate-binding protein
MWLALAVGIAACGSPPPPSDRLLALIPSEPLEVDPRHVVDAQGLRVSRLIFQGLVSIDPHTLEVRPELAESVEPSSDGLSYAVTLRDGLTFSDGSALDSDDVRATFESVVDPATGSRFADNYRRIARIDTPDARHVVFTLREPHAPFLTDLELPIVRREDAAAHLALGEALVTSGPYVVRSVRGRVYDLDARPDWHRGRAAHAALRLVVIRDDNTRALRLLAGAGDVAISSLPPLLVPMFENDPRFVVTSAEGTGTVYVGLELEHAPLDDVRVRRAIAMAIDRAAIAEGKYGGLASIADTWIPEGHWASDPSITLPSFDREAARALLREAGVAEGTELVLRCSSDRTRVSTARAIASMLADVGLSVEVRPSETGILLADLDAGRFDLALMAVPEMLEPHAMARFFESRSIPGGPTGGANRWRFRSDALDGALAQGVRSVAIADRRRAYLEVQRVLVEELPVVPLVHERVVVVSAVSASLSDAPRDGRYGFLAE